MVEGVDLWCNYYDDPVPVLVDVDDAIRLAAVEESGTFSSANIPDIQPFVQLRFSMPTDVLSACGLVFDTVLTEPGGRWARTSRIGGLLSVKSEVDGIVTERIVGITTAHGLVELLDMWRRRNGYNYDEEYESDDQDDDEYGEDDEYGQDDEYDENDEHDEDNDYDKKDDDEDGSEVSPGSHISSIPDDDSARTSDSSSTISFSPEEITEPVADLGDGFRQVGSWIEVDPVFPMQFGKDLWHGLLDLVPASSESETETAPGNSDAADFALFSSEELLQLGNTYRTSEQSRKAVHVESSHGGYTGPGPRANILLGPGQTRSCWLLEGKLPLFVGSSIFNTRRVVLGAPLGETEVP